VLPRPTDAPGTPGTGELEDHGQHGPVGEAPFRSHGAATDGRERAFDDVDRAQMLPVFGREVIEGEQRIAPTRHSPKVEYEHGRSLIESLRVLATWAVQHRPAVERARSKFKTPEDVD
jgi:hypothetical protein